MLSLIPAMVGILCFFWSADEPFNRYRIIGFTFTNLELGTAYLIAGFIATGVCIRCAR